MPLKQTYASIDVTKPNVNLNQHQFLPLVRHHQYYIPGGDLYIQVQNVLFRMHSYFLIRESDEFRKLLLENSQQSYNGLSPSYPLFLPDTDPETLANILWVFYNPKLSIDKWNSILKFATRWGFPEIKDLALRELCKIPEFDTHYDEHEVHLDPTFTVLQAMHEDSMRAIHRNLEDDHGP